MAKVSCSLNPVLIERIKSKAKKEGKSFSATMADLIELAFKINDLNSDSNKKSVEEKWEELYQEQVKASMQNLEINREILRMVYTNNQSKFKEQYKTADQFIEGIRSLINGRIEGKINEHLS